MLKADTDKDRSSKQNYARLFNFLYNLLTQYENPTEIENMVDKKEILYTELSKIKDYETNQENVQETGGNSL